MQIILHFCRCDNEAVDLFIYCLFMFRLLYILRHGSRFSGLGRVRVLRTLNLTSQGREFNPRVGLDYVEKEGLKNIFFPKK